MKGYEIHAGVSHGEDLTDGLFELTHTENSEITYRDGACNADDTVRGTYVHGFMDQAGLLEGWLQWAGLKDVEAFDYEGYRQKEFDRLASEVAGAMPYETLCDLLNIPPKSAD